MGIETHLKQSKILIVRNLISEDGIGSKRVQISSLGLKHIPSLSIFTILLLDISKI
jgi:hypothetical protein